MAIRPLNSVAGFSVGETPANIILANGDITTTNITTTGVSNLNSVGNVKISGGSSGQVISTDGAGNLSFITIGTASLNNGTSNVTVLNSGNILFSVAGNANVGTVTSTGINVSGYLTATGNITALNANLGNAATANYFIGSGNNLSNIQGANVSGAVAYATTANSVAGANVSGEVSFAATANSVAGANVSGTVANANYSAYAGNVVNSSQSNITSLGTLTTLNVNSTVNAVSFFANASTGTAPLVVASTTRVANLNADLLDGYDTATANTASTVVVRDTNGNVSANFFIGNGSQLTGLPSGTSIANGNSNVSAGTANGNITVSVAGNANVVVFTDTGVNIAGTLNATGNANVGNIGATRGVFTNIAGEGGNISNIQGANVSGTVSSASTAGTVTTAAQPNITSTGVLSNLYVASTIYADGFAARTGSDLTLSTAGNGNLIISTAGTGITDFSGKPVSNISSLGVTGNIIAGNVYANSGTVKATTLIGEGGNISNIQGANVSGAVGSATNAAAVLNNVATSGTVYPTFISSTANGNYSLTSNTAYSANIANGFFGATLLGGTLTTAAQPNITSVGTLSSLAVTANITAGNVYANSGIIGANTLTASGNVNAANANITANLTANFVTASNGISITNGPLTVSAGNLDVTGNINVTGNLNYSNVTDLVVGDPLIYIGANNTGDLYDLGIVASYNNGTYIHTGIARNHTTDYWTFFDGVVAEPTTVIDWANATYPTVQLGNLIATANANIGGYANVVGNANVGNLGTAGLIVATGNVTGGNLVTGGVVVATGNVSGGNLTTGGALSVTGNASVGNISANIANLTTANVTGNLYTGNIITGGGSGGNISGANVIFANTFVSNVATGTAPFIVNSTTQVANLNAATAGSATTAGTVTTNAQPNITSVGTLSSLSVTGNISSGNISGTNGNLTTANISSNVILGNSSVTTQITWASVTTTSTSANQTIASLSATGITGVEYLVKAVDSTGSKYSVASVIAVTDGTSVDYSTYGTVQLGGYTGSLAVNIVGGDVRLQVTPASSNSTVWTTQYRLI